MSTTPDPTAIEKPVDNPGVQVAKACLYAPLFALFMGILLFLADPATQTRVIIGAVNVTLIGAGFLCGIVALLRMRTYGTRGILWRTIVGLLLSTSLIVLIVGAVLAARRAHDHMVARAQQQQQFAPPVYTFTPLDGFNKVANPRALPDVVETWFKGNYDANQLGITVMLMGMEGEITNEDAVLSPEAAKTASVFKADWKGHKINVYRVTTRMQSKDVIVFNAQVPLSPKAIQVSVSGTSDREDELRATLDKALANLSGATNW